MGKRVSTTGSGGGVVLQLKHRKYAYSVLLAGAPIAVAYGIVSDSEAGLWLSLAGAALGVGNALALVNTPKSE